MTGNAREAPSLPGRLFRLGARCLVGFRVSPLAGTGPGPLLRVERRLWRQPPLRLSAQARGFPAVAHCARISGAGVRPGRRGCAARAARWPWRAGGGHRRRRSGDTAASTAQQFTVPIDSKTRPPRPASMPAPRPTMMLAAALFTKRVSRGQTAPLVAKPLQEVFRSLM